MADERSFFDKLTSDLQKVKSDREAVQEFTDDDFKKEFLKKASTIEQAVKTLHDQDTRFLQSSISKLNNIERNVTSLNTKKSKTAKKINTKLSSVRNKKRKTENDIRSLSLDVNETLEDNKRDYEVILKENNKKFESLDKKVRGCLNIDFFKNVNENALNWLMDEGLNKLQNVHSFMINKVKGGVTKLDSLANILTIGTWGVIKNTLKNGISAAKWMLSEGWDYLKLISQGLHAMFGYEFGMITSALGINKAIKAVGGGIKFLAKWVTGLISNLFKPPGLFLYGLPILFVFGPMIFNTVWKFVKNNTAKLWKIIDKHLHLSEIWNDIIWPGFNVFWKWLTGDKFSVWWEKTKPIIGKGISDFFTWVLGKDTLRNFIVFSKDAWLWIQNTWETIKTTFNILRETSKVILAVGLVRKVISTAKFIHKSSVIVTNIANKLGTFVGELASSIGKRIGSLLSKASSRFMAVFSKAFPKLSSRLASALNPILKIGSRLLPALGRTVGKILGRLVPGVGWALTAWDILSIGFHTWKAISAKKTLQKVTTQAIIQTGDYLQNVADRSGLSIEEIDTGRLETLQRLGLTEAEAAFRTEEEVRTAQLRSSAAFLGSQFFSLDKNISGDSSATTEERMISLELAARFNDFYNHLNQVYAEGDDVTLNDLIAFQKDANTLLLDSRNEWNKLQRLGRQGVDSNWYSSELRTVIHGGMTDFAEIINNFESYVDRRKENEKQLKKQIEEAKEQGKAIPDLGGGHISNAAINILEKYDNQALSHVSVGKRSEARDKLKKAIHLAVSSGPKSLPFIESGLENFLDNPKFISASMNAATEAAGRHKGKVTTITGGIAGGSLDIFMPENVTEEDINKFAAGGIIVPNAQKDNVIPLNTKAQEFIREKVENLNLPEIKDMKSGQNNITIIEEKPIVEESYQIYTLKKLSKGIIGVKHG